MAKTEIEKIEDFSKELDSLKEVKVLITHQDFIYKEHIRDSLNRVPSDIRQKTLNTFKHYHTVWRNIISYLWKTHLENQIIIEELSRDKTIKDKIEDIKSSIEYEETYNKEMGVE